MGAQESGQQVLERPATISIVDGGLQFRESVKQTPQFNNTLFNKKEEVLQTVSNLISKQTFNN